MHSIIIFSEASILIHSGFYIATLILFKLIYFSNTSLPVLTLKDIARGLSSGFR